MARTGTITRPIFCLAVMLLTSYLISEVISTSSSSDGANTRMTARTRRLRKGRPRVEGKKVDELPYYWLCPEVRCAEVPDTCQLTEFMTLEYQYEVPSKGSVNVRCQSCPYCLDLPPGVGKRAAADQCPQNLVCPSLPEACYTTRLTLTVFGQQPCGLCPACYDHTFLVQGSGESNELL